MGQKCNRNKVIAYYPDWEEYQEDKLQYDILTHIIYAFAIPEKEGSIKELNHPERAEELIEKAHKHKVQVLLAVGGWEYENVILEETFVQATATPEKRERLSENILSICLRYGFDGIDIDWEYPGFDSEGKNSYEELMLLLAEKLHAKGKILTSAVVSGMEAEGGIRKEAAAYTDAVLRAVDWVNVMAYDGGDGKNHSTYDFAVNCGNYWRDARDMPREKVVLGVPFYARPGWGFYRNILAEVPDAWTKDHCTYQGVEVWYNGYNTIRAKAEYAQRELGGIMIWELTQDGQGDKSLLKVIGDTMK